MLLMGVCDICFLPAIDGGDALDAHDSTKFNWRKYSRAIRYHWMLRFVMVTCKVSGEMPASSWTPRSLIELILRRVIRM